MAKQLTPEQEYEGLLEQVSKLAFNQQQKVGMPLREMHCLYHDPEYARYRPYLKLIRGWLVIPFSSWPRDFIGMALYLAEEIRARRVLSPRFILLMRFLREYPPEIAQKIVAMHEHDVKNGKYDGWTNSNKRFEAHFKKILNDPKLKEEWELIKSQFNVDLYRNPAGIIRRYVFCERNFKNKDWYFKFDDDEASFYEIFTAFCERWDLWGVEGEQFLLLKLTVNLLPVGFMIVIPTYMSLNGARDIRWKKISEVLRALGAARMDAKRIADQEDREQEALDILAAHEEATREGLIGKKRTAQVLRVVGLHPDTDRRIIRRRLAQAKRILAERKEEEEFDHPSFHTPYSPEKFINDPTAAPRRKSSQKIVNPVNTSSVAYVKAAIADLSPEEKAELRKWLGN